MYPTCTWYTHPIPHAFDIMLFYIYMAWYGMPHAYHVPTLYCMVFDLHVCGMYGACVVHVHYIPTTYHELYIYL